MYKRQFQAGVKAVYLKNTDYVPRKEPASRFAGGKVALFDRIDVVNVPDAQTAVNALRQGEIDFVENVAPDLLPQLDGVKHVTVRSYGDSTETYTCLLYTSSPATWPANRRWPRSAPRWAWTSRC